MCNRLAELRKSKNLTLKELGKQLSMRDNTLSQYETGKRFPKPEVWDKLASFFRVPVDYLKGSGWSQNETADFFIYVATYNDNEDVFLPSGVTMQKGQIAKYGFDKERLIDFTGFPPTFYNDVLVDYLLKFKSKQVLQEHPEYRNLDKKELKAALKADVDFVSERCLTDKDKKKLLNIAVSKINNPLVNVITPLKAAVPDKVWLRISQLDPGHDEFGDPDFLKFINNLDKGTLSLVRKELINTIPLLHDFKFLGDLSPADVIFSGPAPEYEITKRLINDVKVQYYKNQRDYFESDPYTATEKMIASLEISAKDKQILTNLIEFLIDENADLIDRLEYLESHVDDLENPKNDEKGWYL